MARESVKIALDPALVEKIEHARGDIPKSRWYARAAEHYLQATAREGKGIRRLAETILNDEEP